MVSAREIDFIQRTFKPCIIAFDTKARNIIAFDTNVTKSKHGTVHALQRKVIAKCQTTHYVYENTNTALLVLLNSHIAVLILLWEPPMKAYMIPSFRVNKSKK
jgi:hypothetical protein